MKNSIFLSVFSGKSYKAFILFLVLTFIVWFIIQMVKTYNYSSNLKVEIDDLPKYIILDSSMKRVDVKLKASGLKLWGHNLSSKIIKLNFRDFKKDTSSLILSSTSLKNKIANDFKFDDESVSLNEERIKFSYRNKSTKMVVISPNITVDYKAGYNSLSDLQISPDSILISGPITKLNKINKVNTSEMILKDVRDTIDAEINLEKPLNGIDISKQKVNYFLPVQKFSENTLMVDIKTINVPDSLNLTTYPDTAKVSFLISLKSFDKVSALDFEIICDYNKRFQADEIMIPQLKKFPPNVLNPKLNINKVDYLIKQKE